MGEANSSTARSLTPLTKSFVLYVNIGFYLLLIPFRLRYDHHVDKIMAVRSTGLLKILSLLACLLGQFVLANLIFLQEPYQQEADHARFALTVLGNVSWWLLYAIITAELWWGSEQCANVANNMMAVEREMNKLGIGVHWAFKYPTVITVFLHAHVLAVNLWETEVTYAARSHLSESPFMLFYILEISPGGSTVSAVLNHISLTLFEYCNQMTHFGLKILFILSLIFFVMASSLRRHFEKCSSGQEVLKICILLAKLSNAGSRSLGFGISAMILLLLPYYAFRAQDVFGESWDLQLQYCYYTGSLVLVLAFGAEAHSQVKSFAKILFTPSVDHELSQLKASGDIVSCPWSTFRTKTLLLDVLNGTGIGVRGRCMTITYLFFGSIMASILAYSIAIVQLQALHSSNKDT